MNVTEFSDDELEELSYDMAERVDNLARDGADFSEARAMLIELMDEKTRRERQ